MTVPCNYVLAAAGQTRWALSLSWPESPVARAALLAVFAAAVLAGVVSAWWSGRHRKIILPLRIAALTLLGLVLLRPAIDVLETESVRNVLAVLVDDSLSMSAKAGERTRRDDVYAYLSRHRDEFARLAKDVDVEVIRFGREPKSVGLAALGEPRNPSQDASWLRPAFELLRQRLQAAPGRPEQPLCGVVLLSDGAVNDPTLPKKAARKRIVEEAKQFGAPFLCLLAGGGEANKDIALRLVSRDAFAFVRNPWTAEVEVRARGYAGMRLPVTLHQGGTPVATKVVAVASDDATARVRLTFAPRWAGQTAFEISTPVQGDECLAENNVLRVGVRVIRDKVRVLHVCGRPSWDMRFLRRFLKQTPNVDLISFFIMRHANEQTNVPRNELSLIEFPTHKLFTEELRSFDVVILQNFDYRPYDTGPLRFYDYLKNLRDYVRKDGGALVMVGGDLAFSRGGYAESPLADVLPLRLDPKNDRLDRGEFRPRLTSAGRTHPVTQLSFDPDENAALWAGLPALQGCNVTAGARPGASVLAVHPSVSVGGQPAPIIAAYEAGAGRVLAIAADTTWRWNFVAVGQGQSNLHYLRFWRNALLWLTRSPDLQHVRVSTSTEAAAPGTSVSARVDMLDHNYQPVAGREARVTVTGPGGGEPVMSKTVVTDDRGQARVKFVVDRPGVYEVHAIESANASPAASANRRASLHEDQAQVICRYEGDELADVQPDGDFMQAMADATGGRFGRVVDTKLNPSRIKPKSRERVLGRRSIRLWDNILCLAMIVGMLSVEWWLRRRSA